MQKQAIAVYGISNNLSIAINEIDYTNDLVEWSTISVGDGIIDSGVSKLEWAFDPDCEELYKQFFYVGAMAIPMDDCIRV